MSSINKKTLVLTLLVAMSILVLPVHAWSEVGCEYVDYVNPIEGTWNWSDNEAVEAQQSGWKCQLQFYTYYVDTSADVYKIYIDYDGCYPSFIGAEILYIQYRWGSSGYWHELVSVSMFVFTLNIEISDATSTTLQMRFIDSLRSSTDTYQHTWYFGNEPVLWLYWY